MTNLQGKLASLDKYFSAIAFDYSLDLNEEKALLYRIKAARQLLWRTQKQITFFGVFKAGKSTLLNGLLWQEILPSRTNRATGVVTRISYAARSSVSVIRPHLPASHRESVPLQKLEQYILLDVSGKTAKAPAHIEAVEIELPLSLLQNNCCLADTPGLLDNPILTARTYQELERSDLAVLVLTAEKLLSQAERDAAKKVQEQLNGNIVFIVNRIGEIDPEEREEVLNWVKTSLAGSGNRWVGKPQIFATDAKEALIAKTSGLVNQTNEHLQELLAFESWLQNLFNSPAGERVVLLSRLGILNSHLQQARGYFQIKLAQMQAEVIILEEAAKDDLKTRQASFNQIISEANLQLLVVKNELHQLGEVLQADFTNKAEALIHSHEPEWASKLREIWISVCQSYKSSVEDKTKLALTQIDLPISHLARSFFARLATIGITEDVTTKISRKIGSSSMLAATRWLGRNVFGVDVKQENLEAVRKAAYQAFSGLRAETENYLKQVEDLLVEYSQSHQPKLETPPSLIEARQAVQHYNNLISWCEDFQSAIKNLKEEVMSWESEFNDQWEDFRKGVTGSFCERYEEQRKKLKSKEALNQLINEIVQNQISTWANNNHYNGAWLRRLMREHPTLANEFNTALNAMRVDTPLVPEKPLTKVEITIASLTLVASLVALLWGQNLQNVNLSNINIKQGATAIGLILGGGYYLKQSKNYRGRKNLEKLSNQIVEDLEIPKNQLKGIVAEADTVI